MNGKIVNLVDEEFVIKRAKTILKSKKGRRNFRILAILAVVFCIDQICRIVRRAYLYGRVSGDDVIVLFLYIMLLLVLLGAYSYGYMRRLKKTMKTRDYPYEQLVTFNEEGIAVSEEEYMEGFVWERIRGVCENEHYWFFGANGIAIDKSQLDKEQYAFVEKKYNDILSKNRWIE